MKFDRIALVTASLALLLATHFCLAGVDMWTSGGPTGEKVASIVIDPASPQTLYAATDHGVFRSGDRGTHWTQAGLENASIARLAIDPNRPSTLYALARDNLARSNTPACHVYKTTDGAATWISVASLGSICFLPTCGIAIDPVNSRNVYVAWGEFESNGIFKTTNGGATWSEINAGLPTVTYFGQSSPVPKTPDSLVIDPANPTTLYANYGNSVYRTTNGGAIWSKFIEPAPPGSMLIDSSSTLYLAGSRGFAGIYKGTSSFTLINASVPGAFAIDPSAPGRICFSTPVSTDEVSEPHEFATVVWRSTDGGASWKALANGISNRSVLTMAVDPSGRYFHVGTHDGVFDIETARSAESPVVPIVVDVATAAAHYTTELTLTNDTAEPQTVNLVYTASLGPAEGSGTVTDRLMPGEQKRIEDVVGYLRDKGLAIPASGEQPAGQAGTLRVVTPDFAGVGRVAALARTATNLEGPLPPGRAGLAYGSVEAFPGFTALRVFGLRSSASDRSNLAVVNTSASPMTVRITVFSGSGDRRAVVVREGQTLPSYGWIQINSPELLEWAGITNGWALVERTSDRGGLYVYGVVNDRVTNDGSFLAPSRGGAYGEPGVIPVLVETPAFSSELVLANRSESDAEVTLRYVESLNPDEGAGGSASLTLPGRTQWILPSAIEFLRQKGLTIGPKGGSYAGSMAVSLKPGPSRDVIYAGARTAAPSAAGGEFGLFTPAVAETAGGIYCQSIPSCASPDVNNARVYGLVADARNRSNVAVAHAGFDSSFFKNVSLRLQVHDGDAGGIVKGDPIDVTLAPGQWRQFDGILKAAGVKHGWVEITQTSNDYPPPPWIAYGVINDGGNPGERTGDGAYVPMVK